MLQFETRPDVACACVSCGHESPGWELTETPPTVTEVGDARRHVWCVRRLSGSVEWRSGFYEIDFSCVSSINAPGPSHFSEHLRGCGRPARGPHDRFLNTPLGLVSVPPAAESDPAYIGAEGRRHHRRVGRHRARDGAPAGARRRGAGHLRAAPGSARGRRRRDPRRRRRGAAGGRGRHAREPTCSALVASARSTIRAPRRDDVQRRLRHLRRASTRSTPAQMQQLMDVNYMGTYHAVTRRAARLSASGRGHMIIVSSIVGKRGVPYMGAYAATKFAQVGLAECLRAELRRHGHPCDASSTRSRPRPSSSR